MSSMNKAASNPNRTGLSKTAPVTVDLPALASDPAEIDMTGEMAAELNLRLDEDSIVTWADNLADAKTNLAGTAYDKFAEGRYVIDIAQRNDRKLYIRSQLAVASTGGIGYSFSEFC